MRYINVVRLTLIGIALIMASCENMVEDGYRINYPESSAVFTAEPLNFTSGAAGDVVSFKLSVVSENYIKSCIVETNNEGANGSGYDVGEEGYDDPFADHIYGTVKDGIKSFNVKYDYVIPDDINQSTITFSVIDDEGKVAVVTSVGVVPSIKKYTGINLYSQVAKNSDAFASINGLVYPDISTNYSTMSGENLVIQENIDIMFFYDKDNRQSVIAAPSNSDVSLVLQVENATLFKILYDVTEDDFNTISSASLVKLTEKDSITYYGNTAVRGINVGDIVGFTTDLNAVHSLKRGLIKINALHPTFVDHYEGKAYVLECDIVTQIEE